MPARAPVPRQVRRPGSPAREFESRHRDDMGRRHSIHVGSVPVARQRDALVMGYPSRLVLAVVLIAASFFSPVAATSWFQVGPAMNGTQAGAAFGRTVSFSTDGNRVAVGSPTDGSDLPNRGSFSVFQRDESSSSWSQMGTPILGDPSEGTYLGQSLSLSGDGTIIAVASSNSVRVYQWDGDTSTWTRMSDSQISGWSQIAISLSRDGTRLVCSGYWSPQNWLRLYQYVSGQWVSSETLGGSGHGLNVLDSSAPHNGYDYPQSVAHLESPKMDTRIRITYLTIHHMVSRTLPLTNGVRILPGVGTRAMRVRVGVVLDRWNGCRSSQNHPARVHIPTSSGSQFPFLMMVRSSHWVHQAM